MYLWETSGRFYVSQGAWVLEIDRWWYEHLCTDKNAVLK